MISRLRRFLHNILLSHRSVTFVANGRIISVACADCSAVFEGEVPEWAR